MLTALAVSITSVPAISASAEMAGRIIDSSTLFEFGRQNGRLKKASALEKPSEEEVNRAEVFEDIEKAR